jgi:hypothetical protein
MNRTETWSIRAEVHDHLFVPLIHQDELPARFCEQAFVSGPTIPKPGLPTRENTPSRAAWMRAFARQ